MTISANLALGGWEYYASRQLERSIIRQAQTPPSLATQAQRISDPELTRLITNVGLYLNRVRLGDIASARQIRVADQTADLRIFHSDRRTQIVILPQARLTLEYDVRARGMPGKLVPTDNSVIPVFCPDRDVLTRAPGICTTRGNGGANRVGHHRRSIFEWPARQSKIICNGNFPPSLLQQRAKPSRTMVN